MKKFTFILALIFCFSVFHVWAAEKKDPVLATIDGHKITESQVLQAAIEQMLDRMKKDRIYDLKKNAVNALIDEWLLERAAKNKGMTIEKFVASIESKATKVTESEAKAVYLLQKRRYKNKTFEDVKARLMSQLAVQKKQVALGDFLDELRKKAKISVKLKRPRFDVSVDDDPAIGKKGAPITLIEFSEFQCPFCRKARPTINKILKEYDGKVHYVFRDYPLSFHLQAKNAANAANCAHEQGKYWEFNKELWNAGSVLSKGSKLARDGDKKAGDKVMFEGMYAIGEKLELDMSKFKKCVESKKYYAEINKDQKDGNKSGVSGTPAYFINGVFISGAQPYNKFKEIIEEELILKKVK